QDGVAVAAGHGARHAEEVVQIEVVAAQPGPDGPGEARVVHRAVPAVTVQVGGGVVVVLGDERGPGRQGAAQQRGDLVVEVVGAGAAGHVGHVHPPAVERPDPAGEHLPHAVPDQLAAPVELGQRLDAPPGLVVAGLRVEVVHGAFGGVHVGDGGGEPGVGVAGVVGGDVAEQPHAPPVQRGGQPPQGGVAAEQRVDVIEGGGVVA